MLDINNLELEPLRGSQNPFTDQAGENPTDSQKTPENAPETATRPYIMTLHVAHCRGDAKNVKYASTIKVSDIDDLKLALKYDHMASKMVNNYRHTDNFMECDCIMFDIDNTHTEDPDKWISADDIAEALPVDLYLVRSRNYMKPKSHTDKKTGYTVTAEPREKWHVYCPLSQRLTKKYQLEWIMKNILALFPFVDVSAIDSARFFYGVEEPHITYYEAEDAEAVYIDEYFSAVDRAELKQAQTDAIVDFVRNIRETIYKNDKANRLVVKTVCEFLGYKNPLPEPSETPTPTATIENAEGVPEWMIYADQAEREQWFLDWAEHYGVEVGKRYTFNRAGGIRTIAYCVSCPWEDEHSPGKYPENEAAVFIEQDGKISFKCRHSHGDALNWRKFRAYHESQIQETTEASQDAQEGAGDAPTDYLTEFFNDISGDKYKPYQTGIRFFDNLLDGGPVKQTMLLLLAAPAAGKTTLCQQISESMAEHGKPVLYINLEMSREQMIAKSLSARVTAHGMPMSSVDILQGYRWYPEQREAVADALGEYKAKVAPRLKYNPDKVGGDLEKLKTYLGTIGERAKASGESAPVVVIDYLHLLTRPGDDIKNVITESMQILKDYAEEYDTVTIAISATNRDSNRAGRITMDSGRDSSGIEYSGDYILSLNFYQIDQGTVKTTDMERTGILTSRPWRQMIIRVLKNRWGVAGRPTRVYFHAAGNRFYAEDDFLPDNENIIRFGETDLELENAGMTFDINNLELDENKPRKTPRAGRKR